MINFYSSLNTAEMIALTLAYFAFALHVLNFQTKWVVLNATVPMFLIFVLDRPTLVLS